MSTSDTPEAPELRGWRRWVPVDTAGISAAGQARLLHMSGERLRYSVLATPVAAVPFVLFYRRLGDVSWRWLALWCVCYLGLAALVWVLDRRYQRDRVVLDAAAQLRRWRPRLEAIALLHGLGLSAAVVVLALAGRASHELLLLLYLVVAGTIAGTATHQTPMVGVFLYFFGGACLSLLMAPLVFPAYRLIVLPLAAMFALAIYRHALTAHRFFVRQVQLEERSQHLAEQFRQAKEAAEAALREKSRFLSTASHDLRQPVHAMSMLVAALQARNRDAALTPLLHDLKSSTSSISQMFNSLLDLSRLESGQVQVHMAPLRLAPLLHEVMALYREPAARQGLQLRVRVPPQASVLTDAPLIRQALINLMHNALRYTPRGGVLLAARQRGADWRVEVWDTGIGVAGDDQSHIFSPYYRSRRAWRLDDAGHGLGLAMVAQGARLLGAGYGMRSRLGRGSCFWLRLPAVADAPAAPAWPSVAPVATPQRLTGRCLVLDDDPQVTAAWAPLLTGWGIDTRCAATGSEALALLDAGFVPDAVFCDQRLRSGESGFELLQALLARCPKARGAMVSGEFDSTALQEADAEGYLVLRKPVDPDELRALLERWLSHEAPPESPAAPSP